MITREQAIKKFRKDIDTQQKWSIFTEDVEALLHKIYDDFEKRICENCIHWSNYDYCTRLDISIAIGGCGDYFERKEKEDEL